VIAAAGLLAWLAYAVVELREARVERFSGAKAAQRYGRVRQTVAVVGGLVGLLAALSIVVAVA
jgi:ABC-type nickel/cobalt efflux system permease component RcnA